MRMAARRKRSSSAAASSKAPRRDAADGGERACRRASTSLGTLELCATASGVCSLTFVRGDAPPPKDQPPPSTPLESQAAAWLAQAVAYVDASGARPAPLRFPLDVQRGTPFQRRVWAAMSAVPQGRTTTYGDLARQLRSSPRAVGQAVGANPVAIAQPCHRVLAGGGGLGGFAWGTHAKRALLRREGVAPPPA